MTRSFDDVAAELEKDWAPEVKAVAASAARYFTSQISAQLDLGAQIAQARVDAHMSQKELAARSNVPQPEISRIERGTGNPTRDTLTRLATALKSRFVLVPDETAEPQPLVVS